jgi:hypothetical protein
MLEFFRIIFLNAWRGIRRANVLPALVLMLASLSVLLVGSNASASSTVQGAVRAIGQTVASQTHQVAQQLSLVSPDNGSSTSAVGSHASVAPKSDDTTADNSGKNDKSDAKSSHNSGNQQTTTASVQLNPSQPICQQGQYMYPIASAQLTLPAPAANAGSAKWYWETQTTSGTNNSNTPPPISNTETSQAIAVGATQITLTGSQSQPLVSAPSSTNYAYNFRLHIVYGSTDFTSAWISVPEATGTACPQN